MIATFPRELVSRFDLLVLLVQKELKLKYKGTALGMFWSLLSPLVMTVVYGVVFSILLRFPVRHYGVFLLAGLLPWTFFQSAVNAGTISVISNGHLVRRVRFPVEFLPLTAVIASLVNILPAFLVLFGYALYDGQPLGPPLLALPLLILLLTFFAVGLCLLLSAVTVYFRDLQHLITVALTVWFYGTPVIYPVTLLASHRAVNALVWANPMTWAITANQDIWHGNRWPDPLSAAGLAAAAVIACAAGLAVFARLQRRFAEEV